MIEETYIEADGARLFCRVDGMHDAPALVLHHSLATQLHSFDKIVPALSGSYRIVRFDARGHGKSDAPDGPYDLGHLAEEIVRLMDVLEINTAHFLGLSMGGMVGQYLGLDHPDRVKSLTLASTTSRTPPEARIMWDERIAAVLEHGMAGQVEPTMGRWFTSEFLAKGSPDMLKIADMIAATPKNGFCGWGQAIKKLDLTDRLRGVEIPTLVIAGRDDPGTPVEAAETIHQAISGSRLAVIENASHQSPVEQPGAFTEAVLNFLEDVG